MDTAARPEAADHKQVVRMRRFYLAAGAYAVSVPLLIAAYYIQALSLGPMLRIVALMGAVNIGFYLVIRSGLNQRFEDPSLTWPQVIVATAVLMYTVYYFDKDRGIALMMCLVVLSFGAFRFTTREFLTASGLVLASYLGVINLLFWLKPSTVNVPLEAYRWLTLAFMLPCFSLVGGRLSELRRRLRRTNTELTSALEMIQKMA